MSVTTTALHRRHMAIYLKIHGCVVARVFGVNIWKNTKKRGFSMVVNSSMLPQGLL